MKPLFFGNWIQQNSQSIQFNFFLSIEISKGADTNMRDYSGKKAHQYLSRPDTVISVDTYRSEYRTTKSTSSSSSSFPSYSSFERGGLYSSLRNSLFNKLAPNHHQNTNQQPPAQTHPELLVASSLFSLSNSNEETPRDGTTNKHKRHHHLAVSQSMLRDFRPSIRRRAHSTSAFVNNTT